MIRVDRAGVAAPKVLTGPDEKGIRETARAIDHFRTARPGKPFVFRVYRSPEVKQALERLFHGKCAYCESRYAATQPMDVEHWRPKGAVVEEDDPTPRPGYYWLAADWDNLLPSCIDCNRPRTQVITPEAGKRTVGKGNRFPLAADSPKAREPEAEKHELPLLLHPCKDWPEEHLIFLDDEALVRPRLDAQGRSSAKGEASIEVYALNRTNLVLERRELLLLVEQRYLVIEVLMRILGRERDGSTTRHLAEKLLCSEMEALVRLRRPESPYSQMVRQVTGRFFAALTE